MRTEWYIRNKALVVRNNIGRMDEYIIPLTDKQTQAICNEMFAQGLRPKPDIGWYQKRDWDKDQNNGDKYTTSERPIENNDEGLTQPSPGNQWYAPTSSKANEEANQEEIGKP